ncbi:MAG: hypothetical protein JNK35_05580, partial [Phycisphaerae bacterium]|nr:hypothetical protein [Phycisphaerae bacterium]
MDLAPLRSSWGHRYRVAPVLKASTGSAAGAQFTNLIAAAAASNRFDAGAFPRSSYFAWRAPGQGVHPAHNAPPADDGSGRFGLVSAPAVPSAFRLALAFTEFGPGPNLLWGDGDDEQAAITGLVALDPADPARLYVSRIVAAVNKPSAAPGQTATASLGLGAVDAQGHTHLLADGFGTTSASAIPDKRLLRVAAGARSTALNVLSSAAPTDASATRALASSATPLAVPTILPAGVAGRPVMLALDFASQFQYEAAPGALVASTTHVAGGVALRGAPTFAAGSFALLNPSGTALGIAAAPAKAPGSSRLRSVALWGVAPTGAPAGTLRLDLPSDPGSLLDPADGYDPAALFASPLDLELTNLGGQAPFRGSSGPVALTVLPGGDLLVGLAIAPAGGAFVSPQPFHQAIAVARVAASTGAVHWTIAAHTGDPSGQSGKIILGDFGLDGVPGTLDPGESDGIVDRAPGSHIGRLAHLSAALPGATAGPSLSAPAIDRAGNLYFLAAATMRTAEGDRGSVALVRANYDPALHRFELERMLEVGDTLQGLNSLRDYRVEFLSPADGDSIDSAAILAGSLVQDTLPGVDLPALPYSDPRSLGALALRASILYDRDADGTFADPTRPGQSASPDEAYETLLLLMPD